MDRRVDLATSWAACCQSFSKISTVSLFISRRGCLWERVQQVCWLVDLTPHAASICWGETCAPIYGTAQSSCYLWQVLIPSILVLLCEAAHCSNKSAIKPFHLTISRRTIRCSLHPVYLQKFAYTREELTLKVPALVGEYLERVTKAAEEIPYSRSGGVFCCLGRKGYTFHPLLKLVYHHEYMLVTAGSLG